VFIDEDGKTFKAYGIERGRDRQAPATFLVDPDGKIELRFETNGPVQFLKSKLDAPRVQ